MEKQKEGLIRQAGNVDVSTRSWAGLSVFNSRATDEQLIEGSFRSPHHTLILAHHDRRRGETKADGHVASSIDATGGKLILVPAGCSFQSWQEPSRRDQSFTTVTLDPLASFVQIELGFSQVELAPRIHFEDPAIRSTLLKLGSLTGDAEPTSTLYAQTLGSLLAIELVRAQGVKAEPIRGGLSGWQRRILQDYMAEHLTKEISLEDLARLAQVTPSHLCRAFAQSFGMPPHRYHSELRMVWAKSLLRDRSLSITEVALAVGYGGSSQFARAFRRVAGISAREYRRRFG